MKESFIKLVNADLLIAQSDSEWKDFAVQTITSQASSAIQKRGYFSLVLSGGSTPEPVYKELGSNPLRGLLEWDKIFIFWGDERCVPPTHKDSNYRMTKLSLLDHVPIPRENVFRILGEIQPEIAAQSYQQTINNFFFGKEKRFDTILLGLGDDGHTASLFPNTQGINEKKQWVIPNQHPPTNTNRITLTYPAINSSRHILFLVKGKHKSEIISDVIENPNQPPDYPAKGIVGKEFPPKWIIDKPAAENLNLME
jgi:6-phosphogluconolactonase